MDIQTLLSKYDVPTPRYTSYPTAPHFSQAVDCGVHRGWLSAIPDGTSLSIYLHVPFCAELCWFCGCHTTATKNRAVLDQYADTMLAEIALVRAAIGRRADVAHIHWGGGTPTAMPPDRLAEIMTALGTAFHIRDDAEIAIEIDPRTATPEIIAALGPMGFNRASLGVQDFDLKVQAAVNRHQSFEQTETCAQLLREAGIGSVNLDLIYGLPYQTVEGVADTVRQALRIRPDRVAVFGYAHVPWMKKHQNLIPTESLPGGAERYAQRAAAERTIAEAGYTLVGLDHYALPGDSLAVAAENKALKRNFQGYTTDTAPVLVGIGASSISALPQGYVQNLPSTPAWREAVRAGNLPTARGMELSEEDKFRRDVIETLMCDGRVDLAAVAHAHHRTVADLIDASPKLADLAADELISWDGTVVELTETGQPFVRNVAASFDTYLRPAEGRHARST